MGYAIGVGSAYLLILLAMFLFQRQLLYVPPKDRPQIAAYAGYGLTERQIATNDGLTLTHWYRPALDDQHPIIVVFHGNAGHIGDRVGKYSLFFPDGYGVFFVEFRGYGGNPGSPNEPAMTADARGVIEALLAEGVDPHRLVLYGESLGTGLAVKMASEFPVAGVILEAPPGSIADVAQHHYWWLPAKWLVRDRWDVMPLIAGIDAPLLVIHGDRDPTVPQKFGRRLFDAAKEPKEALYVDGGNHNGLMDRAEVAEAISRFLAERMVEARSPEASD